MEQRGIWGVNYKFSLFGASLLRKCSLFAGENGRARKSERVAQIYPGAFPRAEYCIQKICFTDK